MSLKENLSFECAALSDGVTLVGFKGVERASSPYRLEIFLRLASLGDLDDPLAARATVTIDHGIEGAADYSIHGIIAELDVLEEASDHVLVRVVLAPRLGLLELSSHSRLFTSVALPDVLKTVLEDNGLTSDDYEIRLSQTYAVQEHICQYKESDLAFISRWIEREGVHYFFEQGDRAEKLIITDASSHDTLAPAGLRYHPTAGHDVSSSASFRSFRARRATRPGKIRARDYDYTRPSADVSGEATVYDRGAGEIDIHGYRFFTAADGSRLGRILAEELEADQTVYLGTGAVHNLRPGYTFTLIDHPIDSLNQDYLVVELIHHANLGARTTAMQALTGLEPGETYRIACTAIDADVQFRPRRVTPWPRIHGFEAANVDGPAESDYAQIDDQGRYHVRMHFDEGHLADGQASTAIRMMQPHGGNPEGFHFPLRKGAEVMVCFLGGDPDRPVIAGAVPNARGPSPVTAKNNTRNIIHTGSDNHVELEDLKDGQWIDVRTPPKHTFLHLGTPHDADSHFVVLNTEGDCLFAIGGNQDISVGGELHETVQKDVTETYHATQTTDIKGPQTTTVTAGVTESYASLHLTNVTKQVTEEYQTGQKTTVTKGPRLEMFSAGQHTKVSGGDAQFQWVGPHLRVVSGATANSHTGTLGVLGTEPVIDIWASGGVQIFGPYDGKFDSMNLMVGGATTVITPSLDLHVPFWNWSGIGMTWTRGLTLSISVLSASASIASLSRTGVSISDRAIGLSVSALSLSLTAVSISVSVFKIWSVSGPSIKLFAFTNESPE